MTASLQPIFQRDAFAFIASHHRHHKPPQGWLFGIAANDGERIIGVITIGRPVARMIDDGLTAEVTRCCVLPDLPTFNGHAPSVCSKLYSAAWRACRAMGFRRLLTYTLPSESGSSLRGAGWRCVGEAGGGKWSRPSRIRVDDHPTQAKLLWEVCETGGMP